MKMFSKLGAWWSAFHSPPSSGLTQAEIETLQAAIIDDQNTDWSMTGMSWDDSIKLTRDADMARVQWGPDPWRERKEAARPRARAALYAHWRMLDAGDRPATEITDEIEITPEMVAAGADLLRCEFGSVDFAWSPDEMAVSVFSAMYRLFPMSRKSLTTFGGHPVPEPFTPEQVALAEQLARESFATATVPARGDEAEMRKRGFVLVRRSNGSVHYRKLPTRE